MRRPFDEGPLDVDLACVRDARPEPGATVDVVRLRLVVSTDGRGGDLERSDHLAIATSHGAFLEPRRGEGVFLGPGLAIGTRWVETRDGRTVVVFEGFCRTARASTMAALLRTAARGLVVEVAQACVETLGRLGRDPWRHLEAERLAGAHRAAVGRMEAAGIVPRGYAGGGTPEARVRDIHEAVATGCSRPGDVASGLGLAASELQDLFVGAGLTAAFDVDAASGG